MDQKKSIEEREHFDQSDWRNGIETGNSREGASLGEGQELSPDM